MCYSYFGGGCKSNLEKHVKLLVQKGANVNAVDGSGLSMIDTAVNNRYNDIVMLLLDSMGEGRISFSSNGLYIPNLKLLASIVSIQVRLLSRGNLPGLRPISPWRNRPSRNHVQNPSYNNKRFLLPSPRPKKILLPRATQT